MPWALNIQIWLCFERCTSATPWSLKNLDNLIEDCLGIFTLTLWWSSTAPSWTPSGHGTLKPASMRRCTVPCTWQTEEKNGEHFRHENQKSDTVLLYFSEGGNGRIRVLCCGGKQSNLDLSWNVGKNSSCCACRILSKTAMPLMDVSFMQQSVGGSAMNFGGELPSFSLTKVSGFYFVFSICWLPFASLLLVSCCFPLGVLLSAAQYTMVQCGKSCYLHRRDAVTRIGGKQWTGGKHKIRNPNPAWKCKRVMHHKICPSQKFGSKTLLPKAACLDNQTFFANHFSWKHEISAHFHLISLSFSSEDQELFPPKKTRWLQGFLRSIPMLPQNTISSSFYQDKTFFTSVHISTHNITSYGRATSQFWVRLAVLMEEVQRHVPLGLVQRRAAKQMTCSEQDLPSKTQVGCWFEGSIKTEYGR